MPLWTRPTVPRARGCGWTLILPLLPVGGPAQVQDERRRRRYAHGKRGHGNRFKPDTWGDCAANGSAGWPASAGARAGGIDGRDRANPMVAAPSPADGDPDHSEQNSASRGIIPLTHPFIYVRI